MAGIKAAIGTMKSNSAGSTDASKLLKTNPKAPPAWATERVVRGKGLSAMPQAVRAKGKTARRNRHKLGVSPRITMRRPQTVGTRKTRIPAQPNICHSQSAAQAPLRPKTL